MKYRNPVNSILLAFFVPFYTYWWWYDTGREMQKVGVQKVPNIMLPLSTMIVYIIALIVLLIRTMAFVIHNLPTDGSAPVQPALPGEFWLIYIFAFFLWIAVGIYCYQFCKAAATLVVLDAAPGLMTAVFILLPPLGVYLIQDKLNHRYYPPQWPQQPPAQPMPSSPVT